MQSIDYDTDGLGVGFEFSLVFMRLAMRLMLLIRNRSKWESKFFTKWENVL